MINNRSSGKHLLITLFIIGCIALSLYLGSSPTEAVQHITDPGAINANNADKVNGRVVMVVIDNITWDDIISSEVPTLKKLASEGTSGLMTTSGAGGTPRAPASTHGTVGAGAKISGGGLGGLAFNASETYENASAVDVYGRITGYQAASDQIVHLGLADIERSNSRLKYQFLPGYLGTALHNSGFKTAVVGNADIPWRKQSMDRYRRQAVNIAMDYTGKVDYGNISSDTYIPNYESLAGVSTDFNKLLREFKNVYSRAQLIVVETGDTSRIEQMANIASREIIVNHRREALATADLFMGELLQNIDLQKDLVIVLSPTPPGDATEEGNYLTPFIMAGGGVENGLAWTGTVKRKGLIANTDITPTMLNHLDIEKLLAFGSEEAKITLSGQIIQSVSDDMPFITITDLNQDTVFLYNARYPLVRTFLNTAIAIVVTAIVVSVLKISFRPILKPLRFLLLAVTVMPGILLWANYLSYFSISTTVMIFIAVTIFLTFLASFIGRENTLRPFMITTGLTALMIVVDIFMGSPLAKTSPFSYDAMIGARFYGIGNEYMGVLIGCVIIFTGVAFDALKLSGRIPKAIASLIFLIVIYSIAAPNLGTNVGGTIAAIGGFGATWLILCGVKINKRSVALVTSMIVVALGVFTTYDLTRPLAEQSHIGRTVTLITGNGISEIINIIGRKWAINIKLIKNTSWSWFFFTSLLTILFINKILPLETKKFSDVYPMFNRVLGGIVIGGFFALVFNDSGVVAAATMISYAITPFLAGLITVFEKERKTSI